ncbi:hypothetical protein MUN81_16970 [Hymenobacter sp. 5317J-9]|uniref:hypothetical protein n=1 Tax=Hymenobacter sp. 5317J-9 TaxID=2932250 RepID=UPI001FD6840B|nr:hypothetical protein [Hymenobacter sp. 5317J-9]UOQ96924.1 hypothetical protein MUN81_16970 [Hymenobacter sp. 5317J-9]
MDAGEYKQFKNKGQVLDFATLNMTRQYLQQFGRHDLSDTINHLLIHNKIEKPALHNNQQEVYTDFYQVDISARDLEIITSMFLDLEAAAVPESGESTTLTAHYGAMLDKWSNLQ